MGNPVAWFEIYVQDMARAKAFYETVFQVQLQALGDPAGQMEMWSFPGDMNSYGTPGALVKRPGVPSGGNSTVVYFHCEDCAVEEARVAGAGGQVHRSKFPIGPYGCIALVVDPEGNMVGLHSMG
jgi:predicted enzyme related to lactoylglutathione lyase